MRLRYIGTRLRKFSMIMPLIVAILVILANKEYISNAKEIFGVTLPIFFPSIVGTVASGIYIVLAGSLLGKALLSHEEERYLRFMFGILFLIFLLIFVGTAMTIFYKLNLLGLAVVLLVPPALSIVSSIIMKLRKRNMSRKQSIAERADEFRYFSPVYVPFLVLISYCLFLLVKSRSGWVYGTVWDAIDPSFLIVFFLAGFVLVGIILYSQTQTASKMLLTIMYSFVCMSIFAIVLYPDNYGDPIGHMATAQMIYKHGSLRVLPFARTLTPWTIYYLVKAKGLALLVAVATNMLMIDVYWVHTFMIPILWSTFIPLIAYKVTKTIGVEERFCVLSAFLATVHIGLVQWGQRGTANSLGFIPFFMCIYLSLRYLRSPTRTILLPLAVFTAIVAGFTHPFTGVMPLIFVFLAISMKRYEVTRIKSPRKARTLMFLSFVLGVLGLLIVFGFNNIVYLYFAPPSVRARYASEEVIAFDVEKLLSTDVWKLIFEEYAFYTFRDVVLYGMIVFLGIVGFALALKKNKYTRYSRVLTLFMLSAFMVIFIDYRILEYAMIRVPFGGGRMLAFRDLIALPFAAITVGFFIEFFERGSSNKITRNFFSFKRWSVKLSVKKIFVGFLICVSFSAFAVPSIYDAYTRTRGLWPTELEVEAVMFIDEYTDGPYIVISNPTTAMIGMGFMGVYNYEKYYVHSKGKYFYEPSITDMVGYMEIAGADIGYFIASTMRNTNYAEVVEEASRMFGSFATLNNDKGEISIFKYRIPPFPYTSDVMVFYWDTPEGYYVQNDLLRLIFNPVTNFLDVKDPRWDVVYESIDLKKMLVGGEPLGNFTSIEYYDPSRDMWVEWDKSAEVPSLPDRFEFRINFESDSLVGVVERGKSSVDSRWEGGQAASMSLEVGDFKRLYVPGLVGGVDSYDVNSLRFGMFYTASLKSDVLLHSVNNYDVGGSNLTFNDIMNYCNLTWTKGSVSYDLYVENTANKNQWAHIEVWLPDEIYTGTFPPISYSPDYGETWIRAITGTINEPMETLGGTAVNWVFTVPRTSSEVPKRWSFSTGGDGGPFVLPENFTNSGGAHNRFLFGVYLPAGDEILVRLGAPTYYVRPLKITYIFRDSELANMAESLIKFYNLGSSEYVGGLILENVPTSLAIVQDEASDIMSLLITIPPTTPFSLLSGKEVDTITDVDRDGIPDYIEGS